MVERESWRKQRYHAATSEIYSPVLLLRLNSIRSASIHCLVRFHPHYDRDMWLSWRSQHIDFYNQMASTADDVSAEVLDKLIYIAGAYAAADVAENVLKLSSSIASHQELLEDQKGFDDLPTATGFLKALIADVRRERKPVGRPIADTVIDQIKSWFRTDDPLLIARDEEAGYGCLDRFAN